MGQELHLRHLAEVWEPGGFLQASLLRAWAGEARPVPHPPLSPKEKRARIEAKIERSLNRTHRWIVRLDRVDGDPDAEPEPIEEQHDREATDYV